MLILRPLVTKLTKMKGQSLIELLLAFSIIGIVLSGVIVSITSALNNANFSKNQTAASQYAQEGIEVLRSIRNSDYALFATRTGDFCLGDPSSGLTSSTSCTSPNIENFYIRTVNIQPAPACAPNVAKATVTVSWTDGKCQSGVYCHNSKLISCLSTSNPIQAP